MYRESETLELKKSLSQLREGIISLCSMLNKKHEGEVIFGINDDGKVFDVSIGDKTIQDIAHDIRNNLKPLPDIEIKKEKLDGKNIIRVNVHGDDTPYSAYGKYYIRINDSDTSMDADRLKKFFEDKKDNYSKWENAETKFGPDDIDEDMLLTCIRTANDVGRLDYIYSNAQETLTKFGLLTDNGHLNNAGLYLFGNNRPLKIKLACFPTDSRTDFGEIKEFEGNIFECINEAISYIQNHITFKAEIIGLQRVETPEIPVKAIREIVINSFAHRAYAKEGDYNSYAIYRSYVRIYNAGPILNDTDPKAFADGRVGSKIRNPLIASVLYKCGYIDAFGTGFGRTFSLCDQTKTSYEYFNDEFGFTFIFKRKPGFIEDSILQLREDEYVMPKTGLDERLIFLLKVNNRMTIPQLAEKTGKSEPTIHRHLSALISSGRIVRVGSRKNGRWEVIC